MDKSEKFCLKWNDFEANISEGFRELREEKDFFDVTLACDDNQVQAHKVIISACSPFFRNILRRNPHQHPLLYLKGVRLKDLLSILNFMYMGEVNVAQEDLNSFLSVAEDLRVKGLTQNNSKQSGGKKPIEKESPSTSVPPNTAAKVLTTKQVKEIEEVAVVKLETTEPSQYDPQESGHVNEAIESRDPVSTVSVDDFYQADDGYQGQYDVTSVNNFDNTYGSRDDTGNELKSREIETLKPQTKNKMKTTIQRSKAKIVTEKKPTAVKEIVKEPHSFIRFGSAWQCEECKTLFSRKSYAEEHSMEEREKLQQL